MALNKQQIGFPFLKGINQKPSEKNKPVGEMDNVTNCVQDKTGQIDVRRGISQYITNVETTTGLAPLPSPIDGCESLSHFEEQTILFNKNMTYSQRSDGSWTEEGAACKSLLDVERVHSNSGVVADNAEYGTDGTFEYFVWQEHPDSFKGSALSTTSYSADYELQQPSSDFYYRIKYMVRDRQTKTVVYGPVLLEAPPNTMDPGSTSGPPTTFPPGQSILAFDPECVSFTPAVGIPNGSLVVKGTLGYSAPEWIIEDSIVFVKDDAGLWQGGWVDSINTAPASPVDWECTIDQIPVGATFTAGSSYDIIVLLHTGPVRQYQAPNPRLSVFPNVNGSGDTAVVIAAKAGRQTQGIGDNGLAFWVACPPQTGAGNFEASPEVFKLPIHPLIPIFDIDKWYNSTAVNGELAVLYTKFSSAIIPLVWDSGTVLPDVQVSTLTINQGAAAGSRLSSSAAPAKLLTGTTSPTLIEPYYSIAQGFRQNPILGTNTGMYCARSTISLYATNVLSDSR